MDPLLIALTAAFGGAAAAAGALLLVQRRTRREVNLLLERIDQLEEIVPIEGSSSLGAAPATAGVDPAHDAGDPDDDLSRDVLAGRTSFVHRAVVGELSRPTSLAGQAVALVHARIRENLSPADLADELAISLRTLERGLAVELGCTPRQLILALKMREARRLLETGQVRVNEVATRLGFATPSHFSRSFRMFFHVPPSTVVRDHGAGRGGRDH